MVPTDPANSSTLPTVESITVVSTPVSSEIINAPKSIVDEIDTEQMSKAELSLKRRTDALDKAVGSVDGAVEGSARRKLYSNIARGLSLTKTVEEIVDGVIITKEEPDEGAILKYTELGLKVIGDLVEVKTEVNVDASRKELHISSSEKEELVRLREKIYEVKNG